MLVWTGLIALCLIVGCLVLHWMQVEQQLRLGDRAIAAVWLGLSILAISLLATAIFLPLSPPIGLAVAAVWLLFALSFGAVRAELRDGWARLSVALRVWLMGYGLWAGIIAVFASQKVTWIDTGLYHYGLIRWLSEYGVTPGLALLNGQFGFMSAWFAIAAPFNPPGLEGRASAVMNGFILLVAIGQMAIVLGRILRQRALLSDWLLLLLSLTVCLLVTQTHLLSVITVSASPDIVIALLTVMVAWSILIVAEPTVDSAKGFYQQSQPSNVEPSNVEPSNVPVEGSHSSTMGDAIGPALLPLVLSVAAVSMKLTALPLLVVAGAFYFYNHLSFKGLAIGSLVIGGLLLPFLTSEIVVSGCPLYPSTFACLDLPWSPPAAQMQSLLAASRGGTAWFGQPPPDVNPYLWLFQQWFAFNQSSKLIVLLLVLSGAMAVGLLRRSPQIFERSRRMAMVWLVILSVIGIGFMLQAAPLFRFGMGYLLLLPALTGAIILERWQGHHQEHHHEHLLTQRLGPLRHRICLNPMLKLVTKPRAASLLTVGLLSAMVVSIQASETGRDRLFLPPPLAIPTSQVQSLNGIVYFVVQNERGECWAATLPCVQNPRSDIKLRNPQLGIKGGFVAPGPH
ncbi:MAG: hypothetical protein HC800_04525 [Phormidesmis sp. RL_2_1]|nr:hypothetical protein [Phormidesmis sp. RL_2_1]